MSWLKSIEFENDDEGCLAFARDEYISQYEFLCARERSVRSKLMGLAKLPAYERKVQVLCSKKGMGKLTALRLLLETGRFARFKNSRKYTSYLGLTPSERSSGEKQRRACERRGRTGPSSCGGGWSRGWGDWPRRISRRTLTPSSACA